MTRSCPADESNGCSEGIGRLITMLPKTLELMDTSGFPKLI